MAFTHCLHRGGNDYRIGDEPAQCSLVSYRQGQLAGIVQYVRLARHHA